MLMKVSDIVEAVNGRDAGKFFFIIKRENEYAYIANGFSRKLEKPKKKKLKHLKPTSATGGRTAEKLQAGEKVTNRELKRALSGIMEAPQEAEEVC